MTEDVSYSGMFLRTDRPLRVRGLVRINVPIEGRPEPLALTGMVVHVIDQEVANGRVPGVGIKLYGIGGEIREQWVRFVQRLRRKHPGAGQRTIRVHVATPASSPELVRRRNERFKAVLEVRAKTVDELITTYTKDISRGGTFLDTNLELSAGDEIFLELVHPESEEIFGVPCVVRRKVRAGVGVEFVELSKEQSDAFWTFVEPVIELGDEDFTLIEEP